ncbi:16S rRNA (uracil(1498)-N(3))-methyltransferase [Bacillus benzoevorans]|uniref:Ribosomal RNA small subunit methyltransferase E n=1 Tax=Bacillus benzoevorans TaxID=1456 RepID=A0A7X0LVX2_9BACI|nr:16S rRNA (uracil(1498)-N(3))-methyltransferase [Bacillus benzoevorans]MBB6445975.1 16S rRNA (uracil1498-N3)-methyltransferase [Bacillus benzoevorans]
MQRYFADYNSQENRFRITGDDCHHIARVMRMKEKEEILCVSEERKTALCSLTKISDDEVLADVIQWMEESAEMPVDVTIVSGLPKGDKLEWIIQKGTELGAARFIPFTAARSVVKWDEKKAEKKVSRWEKIAKEAAEQSHRAVIPQVLPPISFQTLLRMGSQYDVKLIAYEDQARQGEKSVLAHALKGLKTGSTLLVVFGPEGGLTENEVKELEGNGFRACGLGPRILRTETAPLYLLSAVSYHLELLG